MSKRTELVDDAVRVLREMPEDMQAAAARAIIEYSAGSDEDVTLSGEQLTEVDRRVVDPNRNLIAA
jgi:hypothetical protein